MKAKIALLIISSPFYPLSIYIAPTMELAVFVRVTKIFFVWDYPCLACSFSRTYVDESDRSSFFDEIVVSHDMSWESASRTSETSTADRNSGCFPYRSKI